MNYKAANTQYTASYYINLHCTCACMVNNAKYYPFTQVARNGSAKTILRTATTNRKLHITILLSSRHSVLTTVLTVLVDPQNAQHLAE